METITKIKTTPASSANGEADVQHLKSEVQYRTKLQKISNAIHAATALDEILIDLKDDIIDLVGAERITIYYVDGVKRELVSRFKSGDEVSEIRVPISDKSIAGYTAFHQKMLNIADVYDKKALKAVDPELNFDGSWDQKIQAPDHRRIDFVVGHPRDLLEIEIVSRTDHRVVPHGAGRVLLELRTEEVQETDFTARFESVFDGRD